MDFRTISRYIRKYVELDNRTASNKAIGQYKLDSVSDVARLMGYRATSIWMMGLYLGILDPKSSEMIGLNLIRLWAYMRSTLLRHIARL